MDQQYREALTAFSDADLNIKKQRHDFLKKTAQSNTQLTIPSSDVTWRSDLGEAPNPSELDSELKHYKELFSKLKFSYLEQETKEKFLRAILDDPPLVVEHKTNEALEARNNELKENLSNSKSNVDTLLGELFEISHRVCAEYSDVDERVTSARRMLEEIAEMENELTEDESEIQICDDRLPLPETKKILTVTEKELENTKQTLKSLNERLPQLCEDQILAEKNISDLQTRCLVVQALADEAVRAMSTEERGSRMRKEDTYRWYRSANELYKRFAGIWDFTFDESINLATFTMSTEIGPTRVILHFDDQTFADAEIQFPRGVFRPYHDLVVLAKAHNDVLFFLQELRNRCNCSN